VGRGRALCGSMRCYTRAFPRTSFIVHAISAKLAPPGKATLNRGWRASSHRDTLHVTTRWVSTRNTHLLPAPTTMGAHSDHAHGLRRAVARIRAGGWAV
jgi:hypothetical protein